MCGKDDEKSETYSDYDDGEDTGIIARTPTHSLSIRRTQSVRRSKNMKPVQTEGHQKKTAAAAASVPIPSTFAQAETTTITRKRVQRSQSTCALQQAASALPVHDRTRTSTCGIFGVESSDRNAFGGDMPEATTIRRLVRNRSAGALICATHGHTPVTVDREQRATLTLTPRSLHHDFADTSFSVNETNKRTTITLEQTLKEDVVPMPIGSITFSLRHDCASGCLVVGLRTLELNDLFKLAEQMGCLITRSDKRRIRLFVRYLT